MKNAKNLIVAASIAAVHNGMSRQLAKDLASIVDCVTCADTYPGAVALVPFTACEAISVTLVNDKAFRTLSAKAHKDTSDFFDVTFEDRVYHVKVIVYSINEEVHKRIALNIEEMGDSEFFVRTLANPEAAKRMFASSRVHKDSTITMKDATGCSFDVVLYHTANSERKRCAIIPPEAGIDLEFSEDMLAVDTDERTSRF